MEKRSFERILANLHVQLVCDGILNIGTVANISKNGMCINSKSIMTSDARLEVLIPWREEVIRVYVKINWLIKTEDSNKIGVELLNSPENYLKIVNIFHVFHSIAQPSSIH
jgi:hypothetical protein